MSYYPVSLCGQPKQISPMSSTSSLSSGVSFLQPMPPLIYPGTTAGMAPLPKTVHLNMSNPPQTTNMHPLRANGKPLCNRPKFQCKFCVFCKSNGEDESFYYSHELKDSNGYVSCPILASYTCPVCKATGKFAHTMKYCPVNRGREPDLVPITELKQMRNSTGRQKHPRVEDRMRTLTWQGFF